MDLEQKRILERTLAMDLVTLVNSGEKGAELLIPCCPDENELASRLAEQGVALALKERGQRRIREIEGALRRLNSPDCGLCRECGGSIGVKRLMACPTAELCIDCQSSRERV